MWWGKAPVTREIWQVSKNWLWGGYSYQSSKMRTSSAEACSASGWLADMALPSINFFGSRIVRYFTQDKPCKGIFCGGNEQI
jgi:hypothetical protein